MRRRPLPLNFSSEISKRQLRSMRLVNASGDWPSPSLGDKIQRLGQLRPSFLRVLEPMVDTMLAKLDADAARRKA